MVLLCRSLMWTFAGTLNDASETTHTVETATFLLHLVDFFFSTERAVP
jgi:hypothetical protein